jgi:GABA(A) receptor-associated protein
MTDLILREGELERLTKNHPDKIPLFITKAKGADKLLPDIKRHKFLVPAQFTYGDVICTIRKWVTVEPHKGIFVFIQNTIPSQSTLMSELYAAHKGPDGVLRLEYTSENTFG